MIRVFVIAVLCFVVACQGQDSPEYRVRHPQLEPLEEQVRRTLENALDLWREQLDAATIPAAKAQAYAQLGQVYLAHHFDEAAADALAFATSQVSQNPHWYYYYASALQRGFRLEEAHQALSSSLELQNNPEVRFLRAEVRARMGDANGALADIQRLKMDYELAQDEPPDVNDESASDTTPAAWYALEAQLLAGLKRYSESASSLARALESDPDATALHVPLALLRARLGDANQADNHLRIAGKQLPVAKQPLMHALDSFSRGSEYYLERGRQWMESLNFGQAVADFGVAADIAPSNHEARIAYARALEIVGQVDVAERQYVEALALNPQSSVAHFFLGALYERQQQDDLARRHYTDAIEADSSYLPPRLSLAHALFRDRNYPEALEHYSFYAEARESDLESRYYAGLAALALGDCAAAPEWFQWAANVNPHSLAAQEGIARSFAVCSDDPAELSQAQDIGERLEEKQPDASAAATLAMVYAALNDFESAVRLQDLAIRRSSDEMIIGERDRLTQYESGTRAQVAWLADDPVFDPPRLAMRVLQ